MGFREILAKYAETIWMLNAEERHHLFVSLVEYAEDGTMPDEQGNEKYLFSMMKKEMDDEPIPVKKESRSEINRRNVLNRWNKKNNPNTKDTNHTNDTKNTNCISYENDDTNREETKDAVLLDTNYTNRISYTDCHEEKESVPSPFAPSSLPPKTPNTTPPIIPQPSEEKESISPDGPEQQKKSRKSQDYYGSLSDNQRSRFDIFWKSYPKKTTKQECASWWNENKPDDDLLRSIMNGVTAYKKSNTVLEGYVLDPIRFLKRRRWDDEITSLNKDGKPKKTAEQIAAEQAAYQREIELAERNAPKFI